MQAALATHQALPRAFVAAAIKQFRRDLDDLSHEQAEVLLSAIWSDGHYGFDAALRQRREQVLRASAPLRAAAQLPAQPAAQAVR